ncbi:MAG: AAA family ATPase [Deltaproteobacteria bacterium]|nr:AAA family ATPase [Deltaproteobacteria bacterium]
MLTRLEVSNYKSIKTLGIDLRPFIVVVGPNGTGKTNVVRSLELLGRVLSRGTSEPLAEEGWARVVHREKKPARAGIRLGGTARLSPDRRAGTGATVSVAITLRGNVNDHHVAVVREELHVEFPPERPAVARPPESSEGARLSFVRDGTSVSFPKPADMDLHRERLRHIGIRGLPDGTRQLELLSEPAEDGGLRLLTFFALGPVVTRLADTFRTQRLRLDASALRRDDRSEVSAEDVLGPSGEGLPLAVHRLRGHGEQPGAAFRPILEKLQQVYPRILDVRPEGFGQGRFTLNFKERGIGEPIPLDGVSDGVLHALALLLFLNPRPRFDGLLAVEEPENALHPWSVRTIIQRAQEPRSGCLLLTTHSETVVNAVRDPATLYVAETGDTGTTVIPATSKESALGSILATTGQQLGDLWMDGSLGGVPA